MTVFAKALKVMPALLAVLMLAAGPGCAMSAAGAPHGAQVHEITEPDGSVRYVVEHEDELIDIDPDLIQREGGSSRATYYWVAWVFFWWVLLWIELAMYADDCD
jgi:hypothetical protein